MDFIFFKHFNAYVSVFVLLSLYIRFLVHSKPAARFYNRSYAPIPSYDARYRYVKIQEAPPDQFL
jgi:hypothetical protein